MSDRLRSLPNRTAAWICPACGADPAHSTVPDYCLMRVGSTETGQMVIHRSGAFEGVSNGIRHKATGRVFPGAQHIGRLAGVPGV